MSKSNSVIECGDKLYYDINPDSKRDVPSFFYEKLEGEYEEWNKSGSQLEFYEWCLEKIKK